MRPSFVGCLVIAFAIFTMTTAVAQSVPRSDCSPSAAELKRTAIAARAANPGDDFAVIKALDKAVGVDTAYATTHPAISLSKNEALTAYAILPYLSYRLEVSEPLRKREPIEDVSVSSGVTITVSPTRIDAPDIIKVIVARNGVDVQPVLNSLKPTEVTTRLGAKATLHSGTLLFPCRAFDAAADIRVTLIPDTGANIETIVPRSELALFSTKYADTVGTSLLKLKASEVEAKIGKPTQIDGHRWTYLTPAQQARGYVPNSERLQVYFNDDSVVIDVQPPTYDLALLKRQ